MDAGGVVGVVAARHSRRDVRSGEIHLCRAVLYHVQPRHVRTVGAEIRRVVVEEGKRARQLGLFVDHLGNNHSMVTFMSSLCGAQFLFDDLVYFMSSYVLNGKLE